MGILYNGVLGGFVNKTGPLVGRRIGKKNVVSALPHKSELPATELQGIQRTKFKVLRACLLNFNSLIQIGFRAGMAEARLDAAFTANYRAAISENPPGFRIDYDKLVLSRGKLQVLNALTASYLPDSQTLKFSWLSDVQNRINRETDFVCFSVYDSGLHAITNAMLLAKRSDLSYTMQLHQDFTAGELHCYVTVASATNKDVSNSVYLNL
ncbi:MAG TPA: DUF6266 family protein [Pedobacter sp.]|nr:DUF6266 family protein [Pedobacter sp.]